MTDEQSFVVQSRLPCPSCPSSDAYHIFSDNHGYCFSCGYYEHGNSSVPQTKQQQARTIDYSGEFAGIRTRRLHEDTLRKFNVRVDEGPVIRFPYYSDTGRLIAYKERNQQKEFKWVGKNQDNQLFGQQLYGGGKSIVVTEGELDALSVWSARKNWPVCSVPNGAKAARKALAAQSKYLLTFDEIILLFDNDAAGVEAAEECVQLFPHDRVFLGSLAQYKDASEALQADDAEAIRQAIWNKRHYQPKTIVRGADLYDLVSSPIRGSDADYPYHSLNAVTSGLRRGELVTFTAGSGTGKSTICGEIASSLIDQGFSVKYIALEESVKRTALRLMSVKANKPLHLNNDIPEAEFKSAFDNSLGLDRLFFRDGFGSVNPEHILNDIRFAVNNHGVQWVILYHLSILMSGLDNEDERKCIDRTMTMLRSFCEETQVGMILVSHLRRSQSDKGPEDGAKISLQMLRGSHAIVQLSDIVCCLQRDISKGESTSELVVLKNRFTGVTGPAGHLSYSKETGRLIELPTAPEQSTSSAPATYDDF